MYFGQFSRFTVVHTEESVSVSGGVYVDFSGRQGMGFRPGALWVRKGWNDAYAEFPMLARIGSPRRFLLLGPSAAIGLSENARAHVSAALGAGMTAPMEGMGLTYGVELLALLGVNEVTYDRNPYALLLTAGIGIPLR